MKPPCIVLAGGRSTRMGGGDKCLLPLMGRPMLAHVLDRVAPQSGAILINSNSEPELFKRFGLPVLADGTAGFQGPLSGLLTGLTWARRHHPGATHLLSVACDTPFLPHDLVLRLAAALPGAGIAIAADAERSHPVIGLWPLALAERLDDDLRKGARAVCRWLENFPVREAHCGASQLQNVNTPADLQAAEMAVCAQRATELPGKARLHGRTNIAREVRFFQNFH